MICTGDATKKQLTVAAAALAVLPTSLSSLHLKLQAANAADGNGFRLLAAGASVAADLTLTP